MKRFTNGRVSTSALTVESHKEIDDLKPSYFIILLLKWCLSNITEVAPCLMLNFGTKA